MYLTTAAHVPNAKATHARSCFAQLGSSTPGWTPFAGHLVIIITEVHHIAHGPPDPSPAKGREQSSDLNTKAAPVQRLAMRYNAPHNSSCRRLWPHQSNTLMRVPATPLGRARGVTAETPPLCCQSQGNACDQRCGPEQTASRPNERSLTRNGSCRNRQPLPTVS
uniref:Uncharacterized protein n=1 Tax=Eutreptiella gymnastica TaxID=73025 RepID=A0A7S4FR37_9EUGL|mmetsp:Transcript_31369/g.50854  ORF Transcript_31369/g.50854 Transcript_31369/m.50854 type:complete len:165 (-) Transcript_31369:377-871(-)